MLPKIFFCNFQKVVFSSERCICFPIWFSLCFHSFLWVFWKPILFCKMEKSATLSSYIEFHCYQISLLAPIFLFRKKNPSLIEKTTFIMFLLKFNFNLGSQSDWKPVVKWTILDRTLKHTSGPLNNQVKYKNLHYTYYVFTKILPSLKIKGIFLTIKIELKWLHKMQRSFLAQHQFDRSSNDLIIQWSMKELHVILSYQLLQPEENNSKLKS